MAVQTIRFATKVKFNDLGHKFVFTTLDCPFCGSKNLNIWINFVKSTAVYECGVFCKSCEAFGPVSKRTVARTEDGIVDKKELRAFIEEMLNIWNGNNREYTEEGL